MAKLLLNSNGKALMDENGKVYKAPLSSSSSSSSLKTLLDATKATNGLFYNYTGASVDSLITYSDTENVIDMSSMFDCCESLQTIPLLDTRNVKNMS